MWQGKYIKWNPILEYAGKRFNIEAVHDDWEGFRIWFKPDDETKPMLIAKFNSQLLYSSSDEGDRLNPVQNNIKDEFPHLFWIVEESALVTEFKRQASGIWDDKKITHYCFMGCNQGVDVLSIEEPQFSGIPDDSA